MRNITKQNFFEIHANNSKFTETVFCGVRAIELSSYEAFIYSTITGSQYLDNLVFPFTPKGLMKVFHSHDNDRIVTGLWSGLLPHFTPSRIVIDRPFLIREVKYLIPVEFETELDFAEQISVLYKKQRYPGEMLVHRIESSKDGSGQEGLLEYLSCEYYRTRGYLVDSQIPLAQRYGSPDWMAVSPSILAPGIQVFNGRYIFELAMKSVPWDSKPDGDPVVSSMVGEIIVGEAKVSSGSHSKQIIKYLQSQIFNRSVLSVTDFSDKYLELCDQLSFDLSWKLSLSPSTLERNDFDARRSAEFSEFLVTLSKFFLLSNFSAQDIAEILDFRISDPASKQSELLEAVRSLPLEKLLSS
jgi:hypothetical protein